MFFLCLHVVAKGSHVIQHIIWFISKCQQVGATFSDPVLLVFISPPIYIYIFCYLWSVTCTLALPCRRATALTSTYDTWPKSSPWTTTSQGTSNLIWASVFPVLLWGRSSPWSTQDLFRHLPSVICESDFLLDADQLWGHWIIYQPAGKRLKIWTKCNQAMALGCYHLIKYTAMNLKYVCVLFLESLSIVWWFEFRFDSLNILLTSKLTNKEMSGEANSSFF